MLNQRRFILALTGLTTLEVLKILILSFFSGNGLPNPFIIDILVASIPLYLILLLSKRVRLSQILIISALCFAFYAIRSFGIIIENREIEQIMIFLGIFALICLESVGCYILYKGTGPVYISSQVTDLLKYLILFSMLKSIIKMLKLFQAAGLEIPLGFGERIFLILISSICLFVLFRILIIVVPQHSHKVSENILVANTNIEIKSSYQSSRLLAEDMDFITSEILAYLESTAKYLDPNFTLEKLSEQSAIPKHHISQAINTKLDKNFYGLIAEFRIRHSVKLLEDLNDIKIETLAYNCGFNSVSSFYKNFKKMKGMTPAEYLAKEIGKEKVLEEKKSTS